MFWFFGTKCTFVYKTTVFIQNLYILVNFSGKNFIFSVKSTILLVFQDQMYISGYKSTVFIQNFYILVKLFCKNFIFRVKSTIFLFFQDQMYIFGYKTTLFIQNLYILVKCFGKNFIFRVKSTFFWFSGPNLHFWVQNYGFYPKFVHFGEIFWQKLHF